MKLITAFFMAWGNFLKIPCPVKRWDSKLNKMMLAFLPMVGAIVGGGLVIAMLLVDYVSQWISSEMVMALLVFLTPLAFSGFLHLDGFMDVSDAVLSRRSLEERQRILKDSNIGAFAVISLVILMIAYFVGVRELVSFHGENFPYGTLLLIPILSRGCAGGDVLREKKISASQYAADGEKNRKEILIILVQMLLALGLVERLQPSEYTMLTCYVVVFQCFCQLCFGKYARKQLGGMNGDIAGYEIVVSECIGLLTLAIGLGVIS